MRLKRFMFGVLSGLTFGLLFAPREGKKLRKELSKKSRISGQEGLKVLGEAFKAAGGVKPLMK